MTVAEFGEQLGIGDERRLPGKQQGSHGRVVRQIEQPTIFCVPSGLIARLDQERRRGHDGAGPAGS
ncbi:hypothetical protein, partial [Lactococcus lactis]|uniref:hypothetical protein n=1 Tax=Lactococcus lactis TaxID=1358 RepID=UPI003D0B4A65